MLNYELSNATFEPPNHAFIQNMALHMVDATSGNQVLLEHLMANFYSTHGNQAKVMVEL